MPVNTKDRAERVAFKKKRQLNFLLKWSMMTWENKKLKS